MAGRAPNAVCSGLRNSLTSPSEAGEFIPGDGGACYRSKALRYYLEYRLFRLVLWLFRGRPIGTARRWGHRLGRLAYWLLPRRRRLVLDNLARVFPDKTAAECRDLARQIFATAGSAFVEPLVMSGMDPERAKAHVRYEGKEHLDDLLAAGRGFIFLTAHFGIWEIPMVPLQDQLAPMHVLAKNPSNPYMEKEIEAIRNARKQTTILASGGTLKIFRALRRGDRVGILIDQRVQPTDGILLPFLGEAAWTTPMLASISARTGAPVLPFLCEPTGDDGFRVVFSPPIVPQGEGRDAEYDLTRRYLDFMEKGILERPDLWFWLHDRWKRVKRHSWPQALERLWKLSGIDSSTCQPIAAPRRALAELAANPESLERGDSYLILGGAEDERDAFCRNVAAELIPRGYSFRLISVDPSGRFGEKSTEDDPRALRELDSFDLVAVSLPDVTGAGELEAVSDLLDHRLRSSRSTLLAAPTSWEVPDAGDNSSDTSLRTGVLHTIRV
ncbi:MAG: lysophospholipid acyltransferase family protein [Thermoanaerobaculia bacterium]|nr:lysophospholipid acyltransferase family protein [Thermoanaerobaculia bacterium]